MLHNNEKSKNDWKIIVIAIISGVATGLASGIITVMLEQDSLQKQITALQNQTNVQVNELSDQKIKTAIMNQTLHTIQQSLEKKSLISVKILPHVEFPSDKYVGFSYRLGPGSTYTREVHIENTSLNLIGNKNYTFDIVITNVGGDTAILNYYAFEKVQSNNNSHSILEHDLDINKILKPNSDPLILEYNLTTDSTFSPDGTLYFTVVYDNGYAESGAIPYVYSAR